MLLSLIGLAQESVVVDFESEMLSRYDFVIVDYSKKPITKYVQAFNHAALLFSVDQRL